MGLDTTHDCWHGAYSAFHRWRSKIAECVGINLEEMEGFKESGNPIKWESLNPDVIHILLDHSDCDGQIQWRHTKPLADRLTELLPLLNGDGGGHIGNYKDKTQKFIDGLRLAHKEHKSVLFQ